MTDADAYPVVQPQHGQTGPCPCGCGAMTKVSPVTQRARGWFKGQPRHHHRGRKDPAKRYAVTESGCWQWTGAISAQGYGNIGVGGRYLKAHRWMYEQHVGPIPDGLELDHLCRNTLCVNPDHLEPVTRAVNACRSPNIARLTPDDVRAIRASDEPRRALSDRYGVTTVQIGAIQRRTKWRHIED